MTVHYEWIVEEVDADGDIIDTNAWDTVADARKQLAEPNEPGCHYEWGLTRNQGDDDVGLQDRQWAYVEDGLLPDEFDGGAKIPTKYRNEVVR